MTASNSVPLGDLMAERLGTVEPASFPDEYFDLYSIPAFDSRLPDVALGSSIGSSKQVVRPDDVLLSKIVPHIRRAWVVGADRGRRLIASGEWIVFRSDRFVPAYLRHVLVGDAFHQQFMQTVAGVGGSLLRARPSQVARIRVPLPPLAEQRRIAAILDQADVLKAKRRDALAQLDGLTQSIFIELFGDPVSSPKDCTPGTLGEAVAEMQYGPRFYNEAYSPNGIRIVRITDLDASGALNFDTMPMMDVDDSVRAQFELRSGDIVFARTGATVGKVALIEPSSPPCIAGAYFIRMRFREAILPEFASYVLRTNSIQSLITAQSRQAAQQNFSGPGLRRLPMPIPPIERQREFARRLAAVRKEKTLHQRSLDDFAAMFDSLQHRAFRGEL